MEAGGVLAPFYGSGRAPGRARRGGGAKNLPSLLPGLRVPSVFPGPTQRHDSKVQRLKSHGKGFQRKTH